MALKKFDKLVATSFIGPYLLSFFVAEFVLMMQFLWKYIDDILGKGFGVLDLMELILYFMVTQIPMALPIAVLISSVMVFGNMSEQYELTSMKSAGVSLMRILRPGIVLALSTAALSLLASNYLKPQANFQFQKRFRTIQAQKPSLTIEEKIFNKDFKGFAIRVDEKAEDGTGISKVSMYDHTQTDKSLINFINADSGKMYNSDDGLYFIMELYDGTQYSELKRKKTKVSSDKSRKKYPMMRTEFKQWRKYFDLGEFDTDDEDGIKISRNKEDMLNTLQLLTAIDSVDRYQDQLRQEVNAVKRADIKEQPTPSQTKAAAKNTASSKNESPASTLLDKARQRTTARKQKVKKYKLDLQSPPADSALVSIAQLLSKKDRKRFVTSASTSSGRYKEQLKVSNTKINTSAKKREKYLLRLNQQYAFAAICIVFMFIGGPLGSIIRKGGYGYPLLIAILFYMVFIIMTIMGEKLVRSSEMDAILAAWFSNLLVAPVAAVLSYMALKDMKLSSISIKGLWTKLKMERATTTD